jgi:predicted Zn-dependent protease
LRTVDRAIRAGRGQVFLLDTRAQLLMAIGDFPGARGVAASAVAADRNSLEAWLATAEVELAAGRAESVDRALREIERILADSVVVDRQAIERRSKIESGLAELRADKGRA